MRFVIMAGGRGTRISTVCSEVPKPMISICGKPVLEHTICSIRDQGYKDFIFVIGYMGDVIQNYFGDGTKWGVSISYVIEKTPLGTAGALYHLKTELNEDFFLINGDIVFEVDIDRMYRYHKQKGGLATILTHPNSHPYDSAVIIADKSGCARRWIHKDEQRKWYRNRVNAGIHILSPEIFQMEYKDLFRKEKKLDLDRDLLVPIMNCEKLYVYDSPEYIKDMGTPERLQNVEKDLKKGIRARKSLRNKQKAIFLDRDGTINKYVGFLRDINDLELLPKTSDAIKLINDSGYLAIVITNQPVVARGEVTEEQLQEIHNKLETLLGYDGAYLDAIYYCPHHPHSGYGGEVAELKIDCDCRKPKTGLFEAAAKDFNIDLSSSWMIGDSETDILAGKTVGCQTILVTDSCDSKGADYSRNNLLECIKLITCNE